MTAIQLESIRSEKEKKGYKDRLMKVEASNGNLAEEMAGGRYAGTHCGQSKSLCQKCAGDLS